MKAYSARWAVHASGLALIATTISEPAPARAETFAIEENAEVADPREGNASEIIVTGTVDTLQLNKTSESGSRLNLTPLETPASIEILDGDAVRLRGDLTVQDAAARATGIVNTSGVFGQSLSARGFVGQHSVMQLYDGMRMYNNTLTFPADPRSATASTRAIAGRTGGWIAAILMRARLRVLDAQTRHRDAAEARTTAAIALYKSLGGGWPGSS